MNATRISEGDWVFQRPHWAGPFTAYDRRTETTHDTGAMSIQDARAFADAFDSNNTAPAPAPAAVRYTIAKGSRARAGHQRYRGGEDRTTG